MRASTTSHARTTTTTTPHQFNRSGGFRQPKPRSIPRPRPLPKPGTRR